MKKIKEKDKRNDNNDNIINSKDPTEILNNDENTENRFIKQKSNIMLNQEDYIDELILEETFNLRYSDPINSIALTDDNLLFGSMIGKVVLYNISTRKTKRLYEMTNESISGCSLDSKIGDKKIFYVSIGDESVISLQEKINENNDIEIQSNTINNYDTQQNHMLNCNQAFTMLWKNKLLIIFLYHAKEHDEQICTYSTSYCLLTYSIKNIQNDVNAKILNTKLNINITAEDVSNAQQGDLTSERLAAALANSNNQLNKLNTYADTVNDASIYNIINAMNAIASE